MIAVNVLCAKSEKRYIAYVSKQNSKHENQVILLMISNGEGWNFIAVRKLSALIRGILSKHDNDFYCLNCLHSFTELEQKIWIT